MPPATFIFQAAKLGSRAPILEEFAWAEQLRRAGRPVGRVYGVSGGALTALAFALTLAAEQNPARWGGAAGALADFAAFLRGAGHWQVHQLNLFPKHGFYNLQPLRRWVAARLRAYAGREDIKLSELGLPLYFITMDYGGVFVLYGPPDKTLQMDYFHRHTGPPRDAFILDALTAALSTIVSTAPVCIDGAWFRDTRPALADAGGFVSDLEAADPRPIVRRRPHTAVRPWPLNFITSSFIMHSQDERNQALLTEYYLDLQERQRALTENCAALARAAGSALPKLDWPNVRHVDLPYIGSTEALANMRMAATEKPQLMAGFRQFLSGQLDGFAFDQPANVIYGAGGFSGIVGGMVTTRAVDTGFAQGGGEIRQVFGVSAGVLNGFFHAVQIAAARHPDIYTPAARHALDDLERFIEHVTIERLVRVNYHPLKFWQGWANLGPFEEFILNRLAAYTGSKHPEQITFDDIALPLTVTAARRDGFLDFMGMTAPKREMRFGGRDWEVLRQPVARAMVAGWSMPTYVQPCRLGDQEYTDGGGTFYDPGVFAACLDAELTNLINVHLDEPESHHYPFPPRMHMVQLVFEVHNFAFPELRRRMRPLTDLLYAHYRLRAAQAAWLAQVSPELAAQYPLPPDFRQSWALPGSDGRIPNSEGFPSGF